MKSVMLGKSKAIVIRNENLGDLSSLSLPPGRSGFVVSVAPKQRIRISKDANLNLNDNQEDPPPAPATEAGADL